MRAARNRVAVAMAARFNIAKIAILKTAVDEISSVWTETPIFRARDPQECVPRPPVFAGKF
jgi:hypothetical protein